jgi:glycosyltransferase involved in cell wall biosynthesis
MVTAAICAPVHVTVVVVLDASDDGSAQLSGCYGPDVHFVSIEACNVGAARAAGFRYARALCGDDAPCWYATTDADSRVDPDWLVRQLRHDTDMVLGLVRVADWGAHPSEVMDRYLRAYGPRSDADHIHVHGANMGFNARAYWAVGGFRRLPTGEDVELVTRFEARDYLIRRDAARSVITSARTQARAPRGFAHHLHTLSGASTGDCA